MTLVIVQDHHEGTADDHGPAGDDERLQQREGQLVELYALDWHCGFREGNKGEKGKALFVFAAAQ